MSVNKNKLLIKKEKKLLSESLFSKKLLVLTIAIGAQYKKLAKLTHPSLKKYANRVGGEFLCINKERISETTPHWEKFQIYNLLEKYDRILYLDTDIIVRDDCPNLFDFVPEDMLGMFNEAQFTVRSKEMMIDICKEYGVQLPGWDGRYFNSGVMVISKMHRELFRKPEKEIFNFYEQSYINMIIAGYRPEMFELPYMFNRMTCVDSFTGENRLSSYIVHYAGCPNIELLYPLIKDDLSIWKNLGGDYYSKFKRHIHVLVTGGLGDQINAEPAIRFMKERVYPDADISLSTHHPCLFKHLGLPTYPHEGEEKFIRKPDTPYFEINSLPSPESVNWAVLSNLLCHTVDYCSSALLRRILPVLEKRIQISEEVSEEGLPELMRIMGNNVDLKKLILLHAGRHWQTKTFPLSWWQDVVDKISAAGFTVCLFGKDDDEPDDKRGVLNVTCPKNGIDVRNKLSLEQLITLIKYGKILISNDSSPIHIAGAFDNWIILIPTCKHPEHVLPYRHGSTFFRTKALYKRLTLDDVSSQPTNVHGMSVDFDVKDWGRYLPDPQDVIDEVISIVRGQKSW